KLVMGILGSVVGGVTGARAASVGGAAASGGYKMSKAAMAAGPDFIAKYAPGLATGNSVGTNLGALKTAGASAVNEQGKV
ncbi:hypothetical protein, partial [Streptococcus pneumoniae]|uniref:hypothetical protein n=1 Tax=Streptococcus pneumoniae TaxID=1313 RepID=UPI001E61DF36